jgi:hypothetical protein
MILEKTSPDDTIQPMTLRAASRKHLKTSGYGGGWRGYRAHAHHAWGCTFQLARILWWSAAHALIPGAYPFRARNAVLDMATEIMEDRLLHR